ncbi:MAG: hypothetical protein ACYC7D_01255 [Nitrososphaerales archaeon]
MEPFFSLRRKTIVPLLAAAFVFLAFTLPSVLGIAGTSTTVVADAFSYNSIPGTQFHAPVSQMSAMRLTSNQKGAPLETSQQVTLAPNTAQSEGDISLYPAALRFINDSSYMPQSETSLAVDPNNPDHVVGGFNDARLFFCPLLSASGCPSGYTLSLSGFTVSSDGGNSVLKGNDMPGVATTVLNTTSGKHEAGYMIPFGDPSVVAGVNGHFYYASLSFDAFSGANGIIIGISNSNLFNPNVSCTTSVATPTTNNCWTTRFVFGNLTSTANTVEDKDLAAVDLNPNSPYYGYIYISWDHFFANGGSSSYLSRCTPDLSFCIMLSGGEAPVLSGSDPFVAFTTPAVDRQGNLYVTWCNYGTASTYGPITCSIRSSQPGGREFGQRHSILSFMGKGTTLPSDTVVIGYATEQFRTSSIPNLAIDTSQRGGNLYFAIEVCASGHYYAFSPSVFPGVPSDNPGNCGNSAVLFSKSSNGGNSWSSPQIISPGLGVNTQPYVAVDLSSGTVYVTYYTTTYDSFNHRIDVAASISYNNGNSFSRERITQVSNEPNADPQMYNYNVTSGFGGSFSVPQYGDYFQSVALNGRLWVLFTGNYASEQGVFQADPFLVMTRP